MLLADASERTPARIIMHPSGGFRHGREDRYARELNREWIAAA